MVHLAETVGPFDVTAASTVIVVAGLMGFVVGFVFAKIWNKLHKS
jgi:hypothetical protein